MLSGRSKLAQASPNTTKLSSSQSNPGAGMHKRTSSHGNTNHQSSQQLSPSKMANIVDESSAQVSKTGISTHNLNTGTVPSSGIGTANTSAIAVPSSKGKVSFHSNYWSASDNSTLSKALSS